MREQYQHQLDRVLQDLVELTGVVRNALSAATLALLEADAAAAERVISGDLAIDEARERIEEESFEILALQQPVAGDLRLMVASLRMVTDLERMGDLAVHIAKVARLRYPMKAVPEVLVPTIADLEAEDDKMDQLRRSMFRILLGDAWDEGIEPAVDMALLGRYYERIGDHAVSLGRRVVFLVTGENPVSV